MAKKDEKSIKKEVVVSNGNVKETENITTTENVSENNVEEKTTESVVDENLTVANEIISENEATTDAKDLPAPKEKAPKKEKQDLRTSKDWQESEFCKYRIIVHAGWDRSKFEFYFNEEKITLEVFNERIKNSSVRPK